MKAYDIVGYSYEGAEYCTDCAQFRFGSALYDDQSPPFDDEGNEVHPIFADSETLGECAACGCSLEDQ